MGSSFKSLLVATALLTSLFSLFVLPARPQEPPNHCVLIWLEYLGMDTDYDLDLVNITDWKLIECEVTMHYEVTIKYPSTIKGWYLRERHSVTVTRCYYERTWIYKVYSRNVEVWLVYFTNPCCENIHPHRRPISPWKFGGYWNWTERMEMVLVMDELISKELVKGDPTLTVQGLSANIGNFLYDGYITFDFSAFDEIPGVSHTMSIDGQTVYDGQEIELRTLGFGTRTLLLTLIDAEDNIYPSEISFTTISHINLSCTDNKHNVDPTKATFYVINVTNNGHVNEAINLRTSEPPLPWVAAMINGSVFLDPGETKTVILSVGVATVVPAEGETMEIAVTGESIFGHTSSVTTITTVKTPLGVGYGWMLINEHEYSGDADLFKIDSVGGTMQLVIYNPHPISTIAASATWTIKKIDSWIWGSFNVTTYMCRGELGKLTVKVAKSPIWSEVLAWGDNVFFYGELKAE